MSEEPCKGEALDISLLLFKENETLFTKLLYIKLNNKLKNLIYIYKSYIIIPKKLPLFLMITFFTKMKINSLLDNLKHMLIHC